MTSSAPGLPAHRLTAVELDSGNLEGMPSGVALGPAIPVVPLRADALAMWANLIIGAATGRAIGYRFSGERPAAIVLQSAPVRDAPSLVRRFLAGSSTTARKLAAYLAAVPLTGPVIRLVRQEVVPEAHEEHLVEVLFSGLVVQRAPDLWAVAPGDELYDFRNGVREQLMSGLGTMTIEGVARMIGSYLEAHGRERDAWRSTGDHGCQTVRVGWRRDFLHHGARRCHSRSGSPRTQIAPHLAIGAISDDMAIHGITSTSLDKSETTFEYDIENRALIFTETRWRALRERIRMQLAGLRQ